MTNKNRRKRLLYQSFHRGCKETDALLGNFARKYLENFDDDEMDLYEKFIAEDDWEIYAWISGKKSLPNVHKNKVTDLLLKFDFSKTI